MKFLKKPAVAWGAAVLMIAAAVVIGLTRGGGSASVSPEKLGLDGSLPTSTFVHYVIDVRTRSLSRRRSAYACTTPTGCSGTTV